MRSFRAALLLGLCVVLTGSALALQNSQTPQASATALTNKDVLEMLKTGLGQEIVIAKIKSSNCASDTSPEALKALKAANVPDAVILEMVQAPSIKREKQGTNTALPTLDQIIEKYVQSLGGKETIQKWTTLVIKGSFEYQGKRGTADGYWKAPNKFGSAMEIPEFGRAREGFDGFVAWADNPQTGLREKSGQELSMTKRHSDFYYPLHLHDLYPKMILKGEQKVGDRRTYLVEADPGDGSLVRMYFDAETGLIARTDTESDTAQGRRTTIWYLNDYREVDGTKVAFSRRRPSATGDFVVTVSEVLHNAPIDDVIFTKPTVSAKTQSSSAPSSTLSPNVFRALPPDVAAVMQSLRLSEDQASAAEKTLVGSPDDVNAHLKLIGYYGGGGGGSEKRTEWAKHVFWLIDHHPESAAFGFPLPPVQLVFDNRGWSPSPELINEYRNHWEQAVAAHPRDTVVLSHAALALGNISEIDPNLSLPLARKLVELDPACKDCRGLLGYLYGRAILRFGGSHVPCLPKTLDAEQSVATLRKEVESLTDPEILVSVGLTMKGFSGFYGQSCGGNSDEAVQFGVGLVRKAISLDPSVIDRHFLRDPLSRADVLALVAAGARPDYIARLTRYRGLSFRVTDDFREMLRRAGADATAVMSDQPGRAPKPCWGIFVPGCSSGNEPALLPHLAHCAELDHQFAQQGLPISKPDAEVECRAALALAPGNPFVIIAHAVSLDLMGKHDEARAELQRAVATVPEESEAHAFLARALLSKGQKNDFLLEELKALRLDPNNGDGIALLSTFWANSAGGSVSESDLGTLQSEASAHPNDAVPHFVLGMGYPDKPEAVREFREAVRLAPGVGSYHFYLGVQLNQLGDTEAAVAELDVAQKLDSLFYIPDWYRKRLSSKPKN